MFGIGAGEMVVIAILILIAVGPDRMPALMKTLGKGMRDVRRTTNDLRRSTGIDEILEENDLRDPFGLKAPVQKKPAAKLAKPVAHPVPERSVAGLSNDALLVEQPPGGVDVEFAEHQARAQNIARKLAAAASQETSEPSS
jgi:sec-independent protein translocase protein TatB